MNCTYGLKVDGTVHGKLVNWFSPSLAKNIGNVVLSTFPLLTGIYKPSFFPSEFTQWLYDTFNDAIAYRQQTQTHRGDFLNFLSERQQVKKHSNEDLAAFAATFLFDAFETVSIILAQALYHIAKNDHCQTELRDEILKHTSSSCGACSTIDTISQMQYLDNIVNGMNR